MMLVLWVGHLTVVVALGMSLQTFVLDKAVMVAVILLHHGNLAVPVRLDRGWRRLVVPPSLHRVHYSAIRAPANRP